MIRKNKDGVEWLEFEIFAEIPQIVHGIFLRGNKDSEFSQKTLADLLKIEEIISGQQMQGTNLLKVPTSNSLLRENCDGIFTENLDVGLLIKHADCQATIFYDPMHKAIGAIHCGWRGNVQNIYARAVEFMCQTIGSRAEDLLVGISPSLGPNHSEFIHFQQEWPKSFWEFQTRSTYFDLWQISRHQLEKAGVLSHHIEIAGICTYENKEDFFSYRRDKIKGRNNGTVVAMRR